jgi:hypothetical protein
MPGRQLHATSFNGLPAIGYPDALSVRGHGIPVRLRAGSELSDVGYRRA